MSNRLDRANRLPYLLTRWKGPLALTLFADIANFTEVQSFINSINSRMNITLVLYLTNFNLKNGSNYILSFNNNTITRVYFHQPIFPINLLRSLAIHSIQTTHYTVIDIDLLLSNTLYGNFFKLPDCILRDHYSVILYPAFVVNKEEFHTCRNTGNCSLT